jgi:hypothetical protein
MLQKDNKHNLVKNTHCYTHTTVRRKAYWYNTGKLSRIQKFVILIYKFLGSQPRSLRVRISNWHINPQNSIQRQIIETAYELLYNYIDSQGGRINRQPINPQLYQNMQSECDAVLANLSCPIEDVKKDVEFLISCQEEIIDHQEPRNKNSSTLAKFVFPVSVIVAICIIFGYPSTSELRWVFGIFVVAVPKFMEYKSECAESNELIYEKTILKMLKKIDLE